MVGWPQNHWKTISMKTKKGKAYMCWMMKIYRWRSVDGCVNSCEKERLTYNYWQQDYHFSLWLTFSNSNSYEKPSNATLRELEKRLSLDIELYLFAKQRLLNIHDSVKRWNFSLYKYKFCFLSPAKGLKNECSVAFLKMYNWLNRRHGLTPFWISEGSHGLWCGVSFLKVCLNVSFH